MKENGVCILPYSNIKNLYHKKILTKLIQKLDSNIVLSKYLFENRELETIREDYSYKIHEGKILFPYLLEEILQYLMQMQKSSIEKAEVSILMKNWNRTEEANIIELAKKVKRIQIITQNLKYFQKLEDKLEQMGIGILLTNNRRKSLAKANLILNFDYSEEEINEFVLYPGAIIVNFTQEKVFIQSKAFRGISINDYEIKYFDNEYEIHGFDNKLVYESKIIGKNIKEIQDKIKEDKIRVIALIGKNGRIHENEYLNNNTTVDKKLRNDKIG